MSRRKPIPREPVELRVESLSHDGRGVGRYDGKTVFVPGALPGETVLAAIRRRHRRFDVAQLQQLITTSPDRVVPKCAHFDQCGGCSLQQQVSSAQLRDKQQLLAETLRRVGHVQPNSWLEPLQADIWAYRGKARLGVRYVAKKGRVLVGFRERGSSFITDTERCEILVPEIGGRLRLIADTLMALTIKDAIPQIEVAAGDNALCLVFRVLQEPDEADRTLLGELAGILGCDIFLQPGGPDSVTLLAGRGETLYYDLPDWSLRFHFQPQDFTQVNSSLNRKMVQQALCLLDTDRSETVLDLFCGLGNFSLPLATLAGRVVGVEGDTEMTVRAAGNARLNHLDNTEFHAADLFQPPQNEYWRSVDIDKVLLDPPRAGAEEVAHWLVQKRPVKIVYVSCNPATLARDAGILVNSGYFQLEQAGIMDMFPHTAHTEAMAVFARA